MTVPAQQRSVSAVANQPSWLSLHAPCTATAGYSALNAGTATVLFPAQFELGSPALSPAALVQLLCVLSRCEQRLLG